MTCTTTLRTIANIIEPSGAKTRTITTIERPRTRTRGTFTRSHRACQTRIITNTAQNDTGIEISRITWTRFSSTIDSSE